MRILLTGGAGFVGSHIADAAIQAGHTVAVVDDLSTGSADNLNPDVRLYRVSVTDAAELAKVFAAEKPDVVDHHAAQTDVRRSMSDPAFDAGTNVLGTVNLLQASGEHGVSRFIFASTSAVYAEPQYVPMDEAHPIGPQSGYGVSKHACESYVRILADAAGVRYKIFRYGNVFGPRQDPKGEAGVVAIFGGQLLSGARPRIFGDGTKTRDYVYVGDVARANVLAMEERGDGEVFNLARGVEVSDLQVFEAVRDALGVDVEPEYAPKRPGEAERVSLNCAKASEVLGWRPTVGFEDGVRLTASCRPGR